MEYNKGIRSKKVKVKVRISDGEDMRLTDEIATMIMQMLEESDGSAEIQRNELAGQIGCVPSQINYVITSRFTPEQGYLVESRRGGGGYIRITRMNLGVQPAIMHIINNIGRELDDASCRRMIQNMCSRGMISSTTAVLMTCVLAESCYREIPPAYRGRLRAAQFKQMLLACMD